jgi:GNAT superfamily N-acetyltransferase
MEATETLVRRLGPEDVEAAIALDAKIVGRRRDGYLRPKMREALAESGIQVSLAADVDGRLAGFLLAKVYYGEFGRTEPAAVLDTLGVHPDYRSRGVAASLLDQLRVNLSGLAIPRLETEVSWDDPTLLSFFHHEGFRPAPRLCLALDLQSPAERDRLERRAGRR